VCVCVCGRGRGGGGNAGVVAEVKGVVEAEAEEEVCVVAEVKVDAMMDGEDKVYVA
jgi:formaldehyde-activating enzyme involved in methanogenesis